MVSIGRYPLLQAIYADRDTGIMQAYFQTKGTGRCIIKVVMYQDRYCPPHVEYLTQEEYLAECGHNTLEEA